MSGILAFMTDVTRPQIRLQFTDFVPDPRDPDVMRRVVEVEADVLTFEDGMVTVWLQGTDMGTFPLRSLKEAGFTSGTPGLGRGPDTRTYTVAQVRKQHGNAYQRWTEEDDRRLLELHAAGCDVEALARHFSRQPSAISARLAKLGTDEPPQDSLAPPF